MGVFVEETLFFLTTPLLLVIDDGLHSVFAVEQVNLFRHAVAWWRSRRSGWCQRVRQRTTQGEGGPTRWRNRYGSCAGWGHSWWGRLHSRNTVWGGTIVNFRHFHIRVEPRMRQDLFQARSVSWRVFEEVTDQILALSRDNLMSRTWRWEVENGADNLLILFEGDITAYHVVQQNAHWPDSSGHAHVSPVVDPFRRRVNSSSCKIGKNMEYEISIHSWINEWVVLLLRGSKEKRDKKRDVRFPVWEARE